MKEVEGLLAVILISVVLNGVFIRFVLYQIVDLLRDIKNAQADKEGD